MVQLPMLVVNLSTQIDTVLHLRAYDSYSSATINPPSIYSRWQFIQSHLQYQQHGYGQSDADYSGAPLLTPQCTLNDVIPTDYTYEVHAG
ncbi:unnamed protein product [Rotaria sordida]|uniref:Uncharacterized protein n=1 Tax=Rotaria sordida TaxID=392033 RepID=A0A814JRQ7_9BILA|nr:unnamed protein product [Rotaria sordida]